PGRRFGVVLREPVLAAVEVQQIRSRAGRRAQAVVPVRVCLRERWAARSGGAQRQPDSIRLGGAVVGSLTDDVALVVDIVGSLYLPAARGVDHRVELEELPLHEGPAARGIRPDDVTEVVGEAAVAWRVVDRAERGDLPGRLVEPIRERDIV